MKLDPRTHIVIVLTAGARSDPLERPVVLLPFMVGALIPVVLIRTSWRAIGQGALVGGLMIWASVSSQALFMRIFPERCGLTSLSSIYLEGIWHGLWQSIRFSP